MSVRFGVLSTAKIAVTKVIPALQTAEGCEVVAIASRDVARAREAAGRLGIPEAHGSYEDLLASDAVDAVYIPLPNHLHARWALAAAAARKHVLCEKPLAMTADEAQGMAEACRAAGVFLAEAFMYRFHPQWRRVRELLADGAIGRLAAVQTAFAYDNRDPDDIRNIAAYGGGALRDIGCYAIDSALWLLGSEPEHVLGGVRIDPDFGTDTLTTGTLLFPEGRHATFTCSTQSARAQWVQLLGTGGTLRVETPFDLDPARPTRLLRTGPTRNDPIEELEVPPANHFTLQGEAFARAVVHGGPTPRALDDSLATLRTLDALRASWIPSTA